MPTEVLLITTLPDAGAFADALAVHLQLHVELASSQRQALAALRNGAFSVIIIEQSLVERDPDWAEAVWQNAGLAIPLELNFSISARDRLLREVRASLARRTRELALARTEAISILGSQLKSSITGLLLQTQLALQEPGLPSTLTPRLRHLVDLAAELRERLREGLDSPQAHPPPSPPPLAPFPVLGLQLPNP